jgi:hypothetical protein
MTAAQKFTESHFPKQEIGTLIDLTLGDLMRTAAAVGPFGLAFI